MASQEQRKPGLLETLIALAGTAAMAWMVMPPQERYWAKLNCLSAMHRLSAKLAFQAGHRAMGDELAGRDFQRYGLACRLSQARDALGRELERMRP